MRYWLFKSEPSTWSWQDQVNKGSIGEGWDGVRNYQASNNMKNMKKGDIGFFYHSVKEKKIVGIVCTSPSHMKKIFLISAMPCILNLGSYQVMLLLQWKEINV